MGVLAVIAALLLAACGGGGGDAAAPIPTVSAVSVSTPTYSQSLVITVTGTDVNQQLLVSSPSCTGMGLSSAAPYVSTSTTAYYRCRVSALGASQVSVLRATDLMLLGSAAFTVPPPQVTMTVTNGPAFTGTMVFTLAPDRAPRTVDNFLNYVESGFYLGTVFHRIAPIPNKTLVQGGGYLPITPGVTPTLKPANPPIALEPSTGLGNVQWSLGMARGPALDSATSQFFINLVDNPQFDGAYAVFGSVTAGTDVVTTIGNAPCAAVAGISECAPNPNMQITAARQTQ